MNKKGLRVVAVLVAAFLLLVGCGGGETAGSSSVSSGGQSAASSASSVAGTGKPADIDALVSGYDLPAFEGDDAKYTVNLGYYNCDHMTAACIGQDAGIYEAMGLKVSITGNGNVPEAMSAGKMDMAYAGWTTTLGAVQKGTPLFIAAENHTGGAEYLVANFDIKSPEDLVGKRISVGSDPTNSMNWMEWTKQLGISSNIEDYENFAMSDSDAYFAMVAGQLDAFICCDPWGSVAEYEGTGWIMVRQETDRESGHGTCCKVCMNYDFAEKHPEIAQRMLLAHTVSVQYMYLHPYYAAEIFANNYNVPFETGLMTLYKKLNEEGRTIRWNLNRENMQNQLNSMQEYGVREDINSVDLDDYIDMSYFDACGAMDFETFLQEQVDPVFPLGMTYEEWREKAMEVDGIVEA